MKSKSMVSTVLFIGRGGHFTLNGFLIVLVKIGTACCAAKVFFGWPVGWIKSVFGHRQVGLLDLTLGDSGGRLCLGLIWPQVDSIRAEIDKRWNKEVGDCRQELVFIGVGMDELELYDSLQACLLTDEELNHPDQWTTFSDPFQWPPANR